MDIITLDWETYYDQQYSLSKLTTEEYIRSPLFEGIGIGIKVNDGETVWASGTHAQLKQYLQGFDWVNSAVLAHNNMFDGAILAWLFDIKPKAYLCTAAMARALHGPDVSASLANVAKMYGIGEKGDEVINAKGKRRLDFTPEELSRYGDYCINDVELTYKLFNIMGRNFPMTELRIVDRTLRMFIEPVFELDLPRLERHLDNVLRDKEEVLARVASGKDELMSNPKFAQALIQLGVEPPMKVSLRTGKETYAFAKTDPGFTALLEHEDPDVQALAAARLGVKSTLEETRTQRFIEIAKRGLMPVPLRYCGAHTTRWSATDQINLQNLPSRAGKYAKELKRCILPPEGHVVIEADLSQIEARVLAWMAGQDDLVAAFMRGDDVYKDMASAIYNISVSEVTEAQRFIGKSTILGAGYGMGAEKFRAQLKATAGVVITQEESEKIIAAYRSRYPRIVEFWRRLNYALSCMVQGGVCQLDVPGVLKFSPRGPGIQLPSGLIIHYNGLRAHTTERSTEYTYQTRKGPTKIYGGKSCENVCQGVARCIMGEQILRISKKYPVRLTVHDSVAMVVPEAEAEAAARYTYDCMRWAPAWAAGLPVIGEVSIGPNYGDTKKWKP